MTDKQMDEFEVWFKQYIRDSVQALNERATMIDTIAEDAWQASEPHWRKKERERVVKKLRGLEKEGKQPTLQWIIDYITSSSS